MALRRLLLIKFLEILVLALLLFFMPSCQQESLEPITYLNVAEELCPYFQQFEEEAAARGLKIDLKAAQIKGQLSSIPGGLVGICANTAERQIVIDRNFWDRSSTLSKELIVFHELGHCFLDRGHSNEKRTDGTCASIMRSGKGACVDFYTTSTRTRLLDELFEY